MDAQEFEGLCAAIAPRMKGLATRLTGSLSAADDVFQEAALRVWERLPRLNGHTNLAAYFSRVVANLCMDGHRRRAHESSMPEWLEELVASVPEEDFLEDLAPELRRAVSRLPGKQREALILRYFEQMEYGDVARQLGCTEATARRHVSKAKAALRKRLRVIPAFRTLYRGEE